MVIWKFALYLGVITMVYMLLVSVVAIVRYGRKQGGDDANYPGSAHGSRQDRHLVSAGGTLHH